RGPRRRARRGADVLVRRREAPQGRARTRPAVQGSAHRLNFRRVAADHRYMPDRYRLVTRSDFDGLVCAALLKELDRLEDILFVHPKDMQDGKVEIGPRVITTNLPYVPGVGLAVDD